MKKFSILLCIVFASSGCDTPIKPIADFNVSINNTSLEIKFINLSQQAIDYEWDFGDGRTSNEYEPFHTYASKGIYTVKLSAFYGEMVDYAFQTINVGQPCYCY